MPLPGILGKLIGSKVVDAAETVANIADKFIQTKEEKDAFALELLKAKADIELKASTLEKDIDEMYLKDIQDARGVNARIQESDKASWLAKNIGYCIDIFIVGIWGFLTVYLLSVMLSLVKKDTAVDYTAVTAVWGGVGAYASTIINFHRGTSKGSEDKSKELKAIRESK